MAWSLLEANRYANKLYKSNVPVKDIPEIEIDGKTRKAVNKGSKRGISYVDKDKRRQAKTRQNVNRDLRIREQTNLNPKEAIKAGRKKVKDIRQGKFGGEGREVGHKQSINLVNQQISDLKKALAEGKITKRQYNKELKKLGKLKPGNHPDNLMDKGLTSEENNKQRKEEDALQGRLKEMEEKNPSAVNTIRALLMSSAARKAAWTLGKQVAGHAAFWLNLFTRGLSLGGGLASADGADEYRYPTDHALDTDKKIMEMLEEAELDEIPLDTA
tara:strand:+ start:1206 stop:2021 length:816 start_codon:yes stop_codon:yes gene_type:complete